MPSATSETRLTALVTGANRGLGLETCRQLAGLGYRVVLTARRAADARAAVARLARAGLDAIAEGLDVRDPRAAAACAARLRRARVHVDALVNNAAVYARGGVLATPPARMRATLDTNFLGALWVCRAFVPGMLRAGYGRVVNVSSDYGSFGAGLEGPAAYSLSKAGLNALTLKLAAEVRGDVKVNAAHPGWVRTRMGGPASYRSPDARPAAIAAAGVVWLVTLPADGPNGGFFHDRRPCPW